MALNVTWDDHGREPQCPPDPAYPKGKDVDISDGAAETCTAKLKYPAPRCGVWVVRCDKCGKSVGITAAGRPDDPRSVKLACRARAFIGATGDFPEGKLSPDDEGGLALAIGAWEGKIKMMFGKEIAWLALNPSQALAVAAALKSYAEDMLAASNPDGRH